MTNSIATLITDIQATIRPYLEMQMAARKEFIMAYSKTKKELEGSDLSKEIEAIKTASRDSFFNRENLIKAHIIRSKLDEIGYTKTVIDHYTGRSEKDLTEKLEKDLEKSLGKIELAVKKKVKDQESVTSVDKIYINTGNQFVEGAWTLNHKDGSSKTLEIESILAGGYNIQCLHIRILYKYK